MKDKEEKKAKTEKNVGIVCLIVHSFLE